MLKLFSKRTKAGSIYCTMAIPNIDDIVAELLFEPMMEEEENDINYEAKALSIFQLNNADIECPYYSVHISNAMLFQLIVSYVGCGIPFCQCVQIVTKTKETLGIGDIGCINVGKVIQYIWYLCAMNFNAFNILLTYYICAISIAFDDGNKCNLSYVDACICFSLDCQVYNLHLIALPIHECHTGLNMYNLTKKFLDALCCGCKDNLIRISTDGASYMTG